MMTTRKRKGDSKLHESSRKSKPPTNTCILHVPGYESDHFVSFSSMKKDPEKQLAFQQGRKDKCLQQLSQSSPQMIDVCGQIPSDLHSLDLQTTGYHRKCYQSFTKNLDRLQEEEQSRLTVKRDGSPRKSLHSKV